MNKLEPFQKEGAKLMVKFIHALNADEMGLGKTMQAIECMNMVQAQKVFICCLSSVKYYWRNMLWNWLKIPYHNIQIINSGKDVIDVDTDIVIVNYELVIKEKIYRQLISRKFDVGICDEAHYLGSLDSKRSNKILGIYGVLRNCVYKFMLTGTPLHKPKHLYPMLKTLVPFDVLKPYNTFEKYAFRFCDGYIDAYSGEVVAEGASNLEELKAMLSQFMIRRTEDKYKPPCTFEVIPLRPNPEVVRITTESIGNYGTLRKDVALAKLPECIQYIKDYMLSVDKLVVFFYHREVGQKLLEALIYEFGVEFIIGGTQAIFKQRAVERFIHDPSRRILAAQVQAGGESIDGLQGVCGHAIFVESSGIPKDIKQPIGRLKRRGQVNDIVHVKFLAAEGTIEYAVLSSTLKKQGVIDFLMGDKDA